MTGFRIHPTQRHAACALAATLAAFLQGCGSDDDAVRDHHAPKLVLMVVVDTLRADHLGVYGHARNTSPQIDAFASRSVRYENAFAPTSWTKPSVPSLLTGRMPSSHGVFEGNSKDASGRVTSDVLSEDVFTIAEMMRGAGYATGGFVKNAHLKPFLGFSQGFDEYREGIGDAAAIHAAFLDWADGVRAEDANQKVFAWVHVLDVHWPYLPPPEGVSELPPLETSLDLSEVGQQQLRDRVNDGSVVLGPGDQEALRTLYDACIRGYDQRFGALIDALKTRGWLDDAMILLTSDHGEEFGEHGKLGHGHSLHDGLLRIPLIIRLPRDARAGTTIRRMAGLTDVFPTIANQVGGRIPDEVFGDDLLASIPDESRRDEATFAELMHGRRYERAVRTPSWKLSEGYLYHGAKVAAPTASSSTAVVPGLRVQAKCKSDGTHLEVRELRREDSDDDDLEVRGPVSELDPKTGVFRIGPFTFKTDPTLPVKVRDGSPMSLGDVAPGDVLDVDCEDCDGSTWIAESAEVRPDKRSSTSIKVEGRVTAAAGPEIRVGPVPLRLDEDVIYVGFDVGVPVPERRIPLSALNSQFLHDPNWFERTQALYDMRGPDGEERDAQSANSRIVEHLARRLDVLQYGGDGPAGSAVLDDATLRELEQAGYLGGDR